MSDRGSPLVTPQSVRPLQRDGNITEETVNAVTGTMAEIEEPEEIAGWKNDDSDDDGQIIMGENHGSWFDLKK